MEAGRWHARASAPRRQSGLRVAAEQCVSALRIATGKAMPAPGLGVDVRIKAPGLSAAALAHDDRLVHLSAFAG
ncbi:MAG: hypothetical protein HYU53_11445 [Acidobacteria bacterium]|nr:hypothetical protein [Acidobacteriota bacterium]